jgi:hypothetical protein
VASPQVNKIVHACSNRTVIATGVTDTTGFAPDAV